MWTRQQLLKDGWTPGLIRGVLGDPDEVRARRKGILRFQEHLYLDSRVAAGRQDARFVTVTERRRARRKQREELPRMVSERYSGWRAALTDAARAMVQLNRFAKDARCHPVMAVRIYAVKNEWIEQLWRGGYCKASWVHRLVVAEKQCRECSGEGCARCGESGIWREGWTREFWTFAFAIDGQEYVWHQPREQVRFEPVESVPAQEYVVRKAPAASLSRAGAEEALVLVQWVTAAMAEARQALCAEIVALFDVPTQMIGDTVMENAASLER